MNSFLGTEKKIIDPYLASAKILLGCFFLAIENAVTSADVTYAFTYLFESYSVGAIVFTLGALDLIPMRAQWSNWVKLGSYIALLLVFSQAPLAMALALVSFLLIANLLPKKNPVVFVSILIAGMALPLFTLTAPASPLSYYLHYLRLLTGLRLVSYFFSFFLKKDTSSENKRFLTYFLHPVFYLFPSVLGELTYFYFDQKRRTSVSPALIVRFCLLVISGIPFLLLHQFIEGELLRGQLIQKLIATDGLRFIYYLGLAGTLNFLTFGFLHIGCAAIQIGLLRLEGIPVRYPMNNPFLSRTPLDYWARMNNYVRQMLLETFIRPAHLTLVRLGWKPGASLACCIFGSFALLSVFNLGYRIGHPTRGPEMLIIQELVFASSFALGVLIFPNVSAPKRESAFALAKSYSLKDWGLWLATFLAFFATKSLGIYVNLYFRGFL